MIHLAAAACLLAWQDAKADDNYFPCGDGFEWTYSTSAGGKLTVKMAAVTGKAGRWRVRTNGLRPDDAWPEEITEELSVADDGIRIHAWDARSGDARPGEPRMESGGGASGEGHLLKLPLDKGAKWTGTRPFYFSKKPGHQLLMSGASWFECLAPESLRHDGKDVESVRVRWSSPEAKPEKDGDPSCPGCETTLWLAKGTGTIKGRMLLTWGDLRRDFEWTLTEFRKK